LIDFELCVICWFAKKKNKAKGKWIIFLVTLHSLTPSAAARRRNSLSSAAARVRGEGRRGVARRCARAPALARAPSSSLSEAS
jgi:hypothetical protein